MSAEMVRLGDVAEISSGGTPKRSETAYFGGCIPWVKSGELSDGIVLATDESLTDEGFRNCAAKWLEPGALLFAMYGATVGAMAELGVRATTNQAIAGITPLNHANLDRKYLGRVLEDRAPTLKAWARGGAQPNINLGMLRQLEIPLPPIEEQRRIAAILDAADALRAKRRQAIAKLESLAQAIFVDMFGDPVANRKGLDLVSLGTLGVWRSGGTPPRGKPEFFDGTIPWFSSGELNSIYVSRSNEMVTLSALQDTAVKPVSKGSLMLGMYDTAALKSAIAAVDCACNQAVAFAEIESELASARYVYTAVQVGKAHYRRLQRGIRQKNLNLELIRGICIPLGPLGQQREFDERVRQVDASLSTHRESLRNFEALFESLQQRAFRGEL